MSNKAKVRRMFEVQSTSIHKVGFDASVPGAGRGYMVVQFVTNLAVYGYDDVAYEDFLELLNAESVGTVMTKLRKKYKGVILSVTTGLSSGASTPAGKEKTEAVPLMSVLEETTRRTKKP